MSKGKRGLSVNKPCTKCGAEVPGLFVSPVQEGLCGKCSDELIRDREERSRPVIKEVFLERAHVLRMILLVVVGIVVGLAVGILLAGAAPSLWASLVDPVKGLFGG